MYGVESTAFLEQNVGPQCFDAHFKKPQEQNVVQIQENLKKIVCADSFLTDWCNVPSLFAYWYGRTDKKSSQIYPN